MNDTEAIIFIENIDWTDSGTWRTSAALTLFQNFQNGTLTPLAGISINDLSPQRVEIETALNSYFNYY
jgi:hypothetical protein